MPTSPATGRPRRLVRLPKAALPALCQADAPLARLIAQIGPCQFRAGNAQGPLCALVQMIIYQQLATRAADTIWGRVCALFPAGAFPSAQALLAVPDETLRGAGVSGQKQRYIRDLCEKTQAGVLTLNTLPALPDEEVIAHLVQVKGIGRWSAQMFLMFYLGRLDVWPSGDLGIQNAFAGLYRLPTAPSEKELLLHGPRFSPYSSIASWYLWRFLELPKETQALLSKPE